MIAWAKLEKHARDTLTKYYHRTLFNVKAPEFGFCAVTWEEEDGTIYVAAARVPAPDYADPILTIFRCQAHETPGHAHLKQACERNEKTLRAKVGTCSWNTEYQHQCMPSPDDVRLNILRGRPWHLLMCDLNAVLAYRALPAPLVPPRLLNTIPLPFLSPTPFPRTEP